MPPTTLQISETVFDVVLNGTKIGDGVSEHEAAQLRRDRPGVQVRTRAQTRTVPAAYAVYVDGKQVGEPTIDPGVAAKSAKKLGGKIKLVAA